MGMFITIGQLVIAMREHTVENGGQLEVGMNQASPTQNERLALTVPVIESGRRYTDSMAYAIQVRDHLFGLSDADWWAYRFAIHPNVFAFLHHRL